MSPDEISGIADASQPSAARIYDFLLGGSHNFEIDRQAAQQVLDISPFMPKMFRQIRWFLGEATRRLCEEGFRKFLDFASGLPTMDHIHEVAPQGTKVIYSDIDEVTVAYGLQIIGDNPNIRYLPCHAGEPEKILNSEVITELFGEDRKIAIGFNGIAWFLTDDEFAGSLRTLYDWAAKGSRLFLCDNDVEELTEQGQKMVDLYEGLQKIYIRSLKLVKELIGPWTVADPGFMPLEEWLGIDESASAEMTEGYGGTHVGVILEKR